MMGGYQPMATGYLRLSPADSIPQALQASANHRPGSASIVPCEVSDVLKNNQNRLVSLNNGQDLVEESPTSPVREAKLIPRLGERLTREASAEDVVRRHTVLRGPNIPE